MSTTTAKGRRELYRTHIKAGMTQAEVAELYGVSRQAVHQTTRDKLVREAARRSYDRGDRATEVTCAACGRKGHRTKCRGEGRRCLACGAQNPVAMWIGGPRGGGCPRCGRTPKEARNA